MPLIEIEEEEAKTAVAAKALLDKFYTNPKTKQKLLSLVKDLNPDAPIPELDIQSSLKAELDAFRSEVGGTVKELKEALTTDKRNREVDTLISRERAKLRKDGWDDEGISKIEKVMEERGVVDYDMAAAFVEKQMPKPESVNNGYLADNGWNIAAPADDDTTHKGWLANPRKQSQIEVQKFFSELRAGRGR